MACADPNAMGAPYSPDPVRTYLAQLQAAMTGQNPAIVHDAIVDAEAHLRAAIFAGASPERAIGEYGSPEEIARAYIDAQEFPRIWALQPSAALLGGGAAESGASIPHTNTGDATAGGDASARNSASAGATAAARSVAQSAVFSDDSGASRTNASSGAPVLVQAESLASRLQRIPILGIWFNRYAWGALLYFGAVGFVLSLAYFVWVTVVGSIAIGTVAILIGVVLLVLLLGSVRAICLFEGMVVEAMLGVRMPRRTQPVYTSAGIGFWQRIGCWLSDIRSWLSLAYLLGNFPVSAALFALFVALTSASAVLVGSPILRILGLPIAHFDGDDASYITFFGQRLAPDASGNIYLPLTEAIFAFAAGLVLFTATLWLARGIGWVYGHVVQAIQVARPQAVLVRLHAHPNSGAATHDAPADSPTRREPPRAR